MDAIMITVMSIQIQTNNLTLEEVLTLEIRIKSQKMQTILEEI